MMREIGFRARAFKRERERERERAFKRVKEQRVKEKEKCNEFSLRAFLSLSLHASMMRDISTFPFFLGRSVFLSSCVSSKGVEQQQKQQRKPFEREKIFRKKSPTTYCDH